MQPGSIVVVKPITVSVDSRPFVKWLPVQDEKTMYMVRSINTYPEGVAATLEEGVVGISELGELAISIECLREVLPPEDLTKTIEECLLCPSPMAGESL